MANETNLSSSTDSIKVQIIPLKHLLINNSRLWVNRELLIQKKCHPLETYVFKIFLALCKQLKKEWPDDFPNIFIHRSLIFLPWRVFLSPLVLVALLDTLYKYVHYTATMGERGLRLNTVNLSLTAINVLTHFSSTRSFPSSLQHKSVLATCSLTSLLEWQLAYPTWHDWR